MNGNKQVFEVMQKTLKSGKKCTLVTIVRVFGSAYRREGTKMLIDENMKMTGMISGGCLESDVAVIAKQVMDTGLPTLKRYNMDEDLVWGLGLGCPGKVELYIEPLS